MKYSLMFLLLLVSGLFSSLVQSEGQFYFLAKPANTAAAAKSVQSSLAVYLRWDVLEGELPVDIEELRLERNGVILEQWDINYLPSIDEINRIYHEPAQQQRLMHTLTLLKEIELAEGHDFTPDQFATVLHNRLANPDNDYWSFLASRQNFNIARARKRAYLDTAVSPDTEYVYTLYAIQLDTQEQVKLGQATVNTGNHHQLMPVQDLKQLVSSCDSSQDHYTVTLDWLPPGGSTTDRVANNAQLAGYELYRSTQNLEDNILEAPVRYLAYDASNLNHDGRGEVVFNGLQRVNRQLLTLDGDGDPTSFEFIETANELQKAGLLPGDRRAYYVVGRDFSGHYGETAALVVQIPNRLSPQAPWDFEISFRGGEQPGLVLSWDQVSLDNYLLKYSDRVVCNPLQVASTGLLEYADSSKTCGSPSVTRIDVTKYRLYRFDDATQALGFKDSDGDGVSDRDETEEGLQCDSTSQPDGSTSYAVVDMTDLALGNGERIRISVRDSGNHLVEDEFYHYMLASGTDDGKFSYPVGPFRVRYPDTTPPAPPTYEHVRHSSTACCKLHELNVGQLEWEFSDAIGKYDTLSLADSESQTNPLFMSQFGLSSSELCTEESGGISDFWGTGKPRQLIYPGQYTEDSGFAKGNLPVYCEVEVPETMNLCKSGNWELYETQCADEQVVTDGSFGAGNETLTLTSTDGCIEYYKNIAGQQKKEATSCGTDTPFELQVEFLGGEVCGYALTRDSSNNSSEAVHIPCSVIQTDLTAPSPPQIISLDAFSDHLEFKWRSPLQPTAATLIEITSDVGDEDTQVLSFPANNQQPGFEFEEMASVHTLLGARDKWCIRAMAVGLAGNNQAAKQSDWSGKLCRFRRENGINDTEYLPWPTIRSLDEGVPLNVERAVDYVSSLQGEAPENLPLLIRFSTFNNLFKAADDGGGQGIVLIMRKCLS